MKSYFTKFGAFLLCGVMLAAVGCHDYGEDIQQVNNKVDNLDKNYAVEVEDLEKAIKDLDDKLATDAELAAKITELQNTVNTTINGKVTELQTAIGGKADASALSEAIEDLKALEEAYAKADEDLKTLINGKADNATVTALQGLVNTNKDDVASLKGRIEALEGVDVDTKIEAALVDLKADVAKLKTGLDTAADQVETNKNDITTLKGELETIKTTLGTVEANKTAIEALQKAGYITLKDVADAGYITEAALNTKLNEFKQTYIDGENGLKAELGGKISALESRISTVEGQIEGINTKLNSLSNYTTTEALNNAIGTLRTELKDYVDGLVKELTGKIDAVKVDVNNLINSIQSIVYKPEYADGKARIAYASVAGYKLDGDTKLTYKVYPKEYADSIAAAFNHPENPKSFISYDMTPVAKATVAPTYSLDVVGVAAAEGELTVTVRANGLNALYDGSQSYSAALVLENGIDHYSTEYTNLTVNPAASEYKLVLYKDGVEFDPAKVLSNDVVFNNKVWAKDLFEGLTPMFKPTEGLALNETDFALKYTLKDADGNTLKVSVANEHNAASGLFDVVNNERALNATLKESYNVNNVGEGFEASSTYKFGTDKVVAKANVKLIKFPYTLKVKAKEESSTVGYNQLDKVFTPLTEYSRYFLDKDNKEVSVEEVEKTYFLKGEDYVNITGSKPGVTDLFDISKEIPVTVALKSENGVGKATAENVGDCVYLYYKHYDSIINQSAPTQEAKIVISKIKYSFEFPGVNAMWTYLEDAEEDKLGTPSCTRSFSYEVSDATIKSENKPADQTIATVFKDNASLVKVTVGGVDYIKGDNLNACPVEFEWVDADNVKINYNGLAWNAQTEKNKTYEVVAVYDRKSAEVTVKASITIKDRVRGVYDYGTIATVDPLVYVPNKTDWNNLATKSLNDVFDKMVKLGYLGDGKNVTIEDVFVGTTVSKYEVNSQETPDYGITTGIKLVAADPASVPEVVVGFNYKNLANNPFNLVGLDMPKTYDYVATIKTTYNQEIVLKSGVEFNPDPVYDFVSTQFVKKSDKGYQYSVVNPLYYDASNNLIEQDYNNTPIFRFGIDKVKMADAFEVATPKGQLKASELAANNVKAEFTLEDTYAGINIEDNILTYGGKVEYVDVTGSLKLVNDNNIYYPIAKTIFTEEPSFVAYRVYGFDPLNAMTAPEEPQVWDLTGKTGEFTMNVLNFFSIKDKRGWDLISGDAFVTGDNNNGFAYGKNVKDVYGLNPSFDIKVVSPTDVTVTGITPENGTGTITAKVDANLGILHDIEIEVKLTIEYPYAKDKVASFKVIIPKTHKEEK